MRILLIILSILGFTTNSQAQSPEVKITVLSTMVVGNRSSEVTYGEWGFSALVEVNGKRILFDTGRTPGLVLDNAKKLGIDLSDIEDVVLSHFHHDHTGGLMYMRKELIKKNPKALSRIHVNKGFFYPRLLPDGRHWNSKYPRFTREEYEQTGGEIIIYDEETELLPGVWLSGPVARTTDEKSRGGTVKMDMGNGWIEDIIPDSLSLFIETEDGTIILSGCGHAGIINITREAADVMKTPKLHAIIGGFHLVDQSDERLIWTADELQKGSLDYFIGAHCTGLEATFLMRGQLGLSRQNMVNGAVGSNFTFGEGIYSPIIAR